MRLLPALIWVEGNAPAVPKDPGQLAGATSDDQQAPFCHVLSLSSSLLLFLLLSEFSLRHAFFRQQQTPWMPTPAAFQPCRLKPDLAVNRKCSAAAAVFRWSTGAPDIPGWASPRSYPAALAPSSPVALLPLPFPASPWPPASCFPAVNNFPHS